MLGIEKPSCFSSTIRQVCKREIRGVEWKIDEVLRLRVSQIVWMSATYLLTFKEYTHLKYSPTNFTTPSRYYCKIIDGKCMDNSLTINLGGDFFETTFFGSSSNFVGNVNFY